MLNVNCSGVVPLEGEEVGSRAGVTGGNLTHPEEMPAASPLSGSSVPWHPGDADTSTRHAASPPENPQPSKALETGILAIIPQTSPDPPPREPGPPTAFVNSGGGAEVWPISWRECPHSQG